MSKSSASPTQEHLPLAGIQDGVVIMNDGSLRAILKVEPTNFELKSEEEQNGIIYTYQSFLNSLDFPIQILIQSKKLDLEQYLINLTATTKKISNELLRIQAEDYIDFVRRLITVANIMSKRFYVIVSYAPITAGKAASSLVGFMHKAPTGPLMDQEQFERYRGEVFNRANLISGGMGRLGLKVNLLETQQLIELFYGIYNPDIAAEERLTDIASIESSVVTADQQLGPETQEAAPALPASQPPTAAPPNPPNG